MGIIKELKKFLKIGDYLSDYEEKELLEKVKIENKQQNQSVYYTAARKLYKEYHGCVNIKNDDTAVTVKDMLYIFAVIAVVIAVVIIVVIVLYCILF